MPEKYTFKTMAKYEWIDQDRSMHETEVKERARDPDFGYVGEHIEPITEDLVSYLMYNTLTVKVMGMIESKKKTKSYAYQSDYQSDAAGIVESDANVTSAAAAGQSPTKRM